MKMIRSSIALRMLTAVGVAALLSLVGMAYHYAQHQRETILAQNQLARIQFAEGTIRGLRAVMFTGSAKIARDYAEQIKQIPGVEEMRILRNDGQEAFHDNKTIEAVNFRRGEDLFVPRDTENVVEVLPAKDPHLKQAVESGETVPYYERGKEGDRLLTLLAPIGRMEACQRCHGRGKGPLGLLKMTTSLREADEAIARTDRKAVEMLAISLVLMLGITFLLLHRSIVRPLRLVTQAMVRVEEGDLSQNVPVPSDDEVGSMARSFNTMIARLRATYSGLKEERNKLTTIILSAREGIIATNQTGEVVLVNPAAERLLGKSQDEIVQQGFLNILDDPAFIKAILDSHGIGLPEMVFFKERFLNIYAARILDQQGQEIGSAALIRDITDEKQLEEKLRNLSYTDELTQLYNRRRLEEILSRELHLSQRHRHPVSVILFDVDHFKRFNDTFGHDMGDRVLQVIGRACKTHFRATDYSCRYGGEEFTIILPSTSVHGGRLAAENLRREVEALVIDGQKVTISLGVASYPGCGGEAPTTEMLLKAADQALYSAKHGGRNQVMVAQCAELAAEKGAGA